MRLDEALARLEALGTERMRAQNRRHGVEGPQFGVKLGDIRKLAREIGTDHPLALAFWETGNLDARLLAILVMDPRKLEAADLDRLVRSNRIPQVSDWLLSSVVKRHKEKEALRRSWIESDDPMAARAGWSLTAGRIARDPAGLDLGAILDRLEREMGRAPPEAQWTMNFALAFIGIHHPGLRPRAVAIGETLGLYRNYPTSPGCTSPFAPAWIAEMVRRQAAE